VVRGVDTQGSDAGIGAEAVTARSVD